MVSRRGRARHRVMTTKTIALTVDSDLPRILDMPTPSPASIEAGTVLASGRLRVLRRLGEGGMGVVFEALDLERNVRVALKTMHSMTAQSLARFKREFRALQDVHHPNLVSLGELVSEDDTWFFTMELVDGCDLLEYVRPARSSSLPSSDVASAPSTRGEQLSVAPTERFSRSDEHAARGATCGLTSAMWVIPTKVTTGRILTTIPTVGSRWKSAAAATMATTGTGAKCL